MNSYIKFLFKDKGAICIPISGRIEVNSFLFWKDQIHLSDEGTAVLLKAYNEFIHILKRYSVKDRYKGKLYCFFCGQEGHRIEQCSNKNSNWQRVG